jgi:hypothetical protein
VELVTIHLAGEHRERIALTGRQIPGV